MTELLKSLPYFDDLTDKEKERVTAAAYIRHYEAGTQIYGPCVECVGMIHILRGETRAYLLSDEGRKVTLFRVTENDNCIISASCVLSHLRFEAHMEVTKPSDILIVPVSLFGELCAQNVHDPGKSVHCQKVNSDKVRAKVTYICPKEQWDGLGIDKEKYSEWLDIVHASGSALTPYYEKSDVALLTAPKTFYRDFAVPIKVFEYCSYLKPMLVTNCTETARIVNDNHAGWVTDDNVESVCDQIIHLCENPDEVLNIRDNMKEARDNNLWINRAKQVIEDLKRNK